MVKVRDLSPDLLEVAKNELFEETDRRDSDIAYMRDWLKKQPHIKCNPDDQTILSFLRGCKSSLERTKEKIDFYYTMRTALPEFFKIRDMKSKELLEIYNLGLYVALPGTDPEGRRIFIVRPGVLNPSKHKIEDQFKLNFMMADYMMREDDTFLIKGTVTLLDLGGVGISSAAQMTPSFVKKVTKCQQEGFPIREKGVNFIHTPSLFDTVFNLFKSNSKEKIQKRMYVHGDNFESLYKNIPQHLLPAEYGGKAGTVKDIIAEFRKGFEAYHDWFLSPEGYLGVDESKRPGKPKTHQDLFGLEGSFRQLNVD